MSYYPVLYIEMKDDDAERVSANCTDDIFRAANKEFRQQARKTLKMLEMPEDETPPFEFFQFRIIQESKVIAINAHQCKALQNTR